LQQWYNNTNKFLKNNKNIMFTRADKGNTTVAMNIDNYKEKMNLLLSDSDTYVMIKKDPTRKITDLRTLIKRWRNMDYINDLVYRSLLKTDGLLPRVYGLPKIHKNGHPLKIIVSSINSPLYSLATFLHKILINSIKPPENYIKNSF